MDHFLLQVRKEIISKTCTFTCNTKAPTRIVNQAVIAPTHMVGGLLKVNTVSCSMDGDFYDETRNRQLFTNSRYDRVNCSNRSGTFTSEGTVAVKETLLVII